MARVTHVKAARPRGKDKAGNPLPERTCSTCGQPIQAGTPYKWFKRKLSYGGVRYNYHAGCAIKPSHQTSSAMGQIYDAQEDAGNDVQAAGTAEDVTSAVHALAEVVREVAAEYQEKASNMEDGFGHPTEQSEELQDKGDQLDSWADDLESFDADDAYTDAYDEPDEPDLTDDPEGEAAQAYDDEVEQAESVAMDAARDAGQDAVDGCPV